MKTNAMNSLVDSSSKGGFRLRTLPEGRGADKRLSTIGVVVLSVLGALSLEVRAGQDIMQSGDVAATKRKAEAGDLKSQVALADCLADNGRPAEALYWFRKAAERRSVEGMSRAGELLLFGDNSGSRDQRVVVDAAEGIRLTYGAATNFNLRAGRNMARALQQGLGVSTNGVEAYAWLSLHSVSNAAAVRLDLNRAALNLQAHEIQEGQALARQFRHRQWPALALAPAATAELEADTPQSERAALPLKVNGISLGGDAALVIINRKTLAEGESARIPIVGGTVNVKCLKISEGSVLIEVEGESEPRLLCVN